LGRVRRPGSRARWSEAYEAGLRAKEAGPIGQSTGVACEERRIRRLIRRMAYQPRDFAAKVPADGWLTYLVGEATPPTPGAYRSSASHIDDPVEDQIATWQARLDASWR